MIECWRIHPELMKNKNDKKQTPKDTVQRKGNEKGPLMVLISGKVVGNLGEHWKEVRDSRVQTKAKQNLEKENTGQEIVLVDGTVQQMQTTNKFAILEEEEGEKNENNQLMLIEESNEQRSPRHNLKITGSLNIAATPYKHSSPGITKSKKENNVTPTWNGNAVAQGIQMESTAQWATRTFGGNIVPTNQSGKEIPSHSMCTNVTAAGFKYNDRLQLSESKLWSDQLEEGWMVKYLRESLVKRNQQMRRGKQSNKV